MGSLLLLLGIGMLVLCGGIAASASARAGQEPACIPLEVLFGNPVKTSPQISPDGARLAYLAPVNNVLNVWVKTIGKDDDRSMTHDTNRGIRRYFWAEDNTHIMYLQDRGGDENWRLYAVHLPTGIEKDVTPFDGVQVQIIDHNKHFPHELLIAMNKENPRVHDAYHLDIRTGVITLRAKNPGNISSWIADGQLEIRGAVVETPDGGSELLVRDTEQAAWRKMASWPAEDSLASQPVGFTRDGKSLYLLDSRNADTGRLVQVDVETGKLWVIAGDPAYDVSNIMINPDTLTVEAVSFNRARNEWRVIDPSVRADFKRIARLDRGDFTVFSRDNADAGWIVAFTKDNGPGAFYFYDRKAKKGSFLFYTKPDLKKYELATMEPFSFQSRDGLTLNGYIVFPKGRGRKNLPMVVNVHGGPWARDTWGYDPETQWIANRGYISLQVNFRGSTGYGKKFLNAGDREWGGRMHDDIIDAVQWAIRKGYADPARIVLYGGSYGGYEALVGAAFTPEIFRCAIDVVGPSNLITFIKSIPPYWSTFLAAMHKRVGNPDTEEAFLQSRSPLFKVDNIKIPLLIVQGANDPRVKQREAEQIVEAMKKKNIAYEYLLFPDEGHGFAKPENRLTFYRAAEKFLAKHLGDKE